MLSLLTIGILPMLTKHSPFECVYGVNPLTPIDLLPTPCKSRVSYDDEVRANEMMKLHE